MFAPFNAWIKNKMGAKNTLLIGFVMITVTTFGLGLLSMIKNSQSFLIVALILRFFQGQGDVFLQFVGYSIICTVFADDIMKHIAYIEIAVGLGLGVGPLIGGWLYHAAGYEITMFVFGGFNLVTMIYCWINIPNSLNSTVTDEEVAELNVKVEGLEEEIKETVQPKEKKHPRENIGWLTLFTNRHSCFAIIVAFVGTFNIMYFKEFMVEDLTDEGREVHIEEHQGSYIISIPAIFYLIGCLLLPYTCEHTARKFLFTLACFGFGIQMFALGPSDFFGLSKLPEKTQLIMQICSLPFNGIF